MKKYDRLFFSMEKNKAPSLDGFSQGFLQEFSPLSEKLLTFVNFTIVIVNCQ